MKIRTIDNKSYSGTLIEIVEQMKSAAEQFRKYHSLEEYMLVTARRAKIFQEKTIKIKGGTLRKRCKSFIRSLIKKGLARRIPTMGIWVLLHQNQFWGDSYQEIISKIRTSDIRINPTIKGISLNDYLFYLQDDLGQDLGIEKNLLPAGVNLEIQCEQIINFITRLPIAGFINEANESQIDPIRVYHRLK